MRGNRCDMHDNRREMSGGNVDLAQTLRYYHYFSRRVCARSRLLCCSVAAQGASCLGHMKSIRRSLRGTLFRAFIGTEVTKTLLLNFTPLADQLRKLKHVCNDCGQGIIHQTVR